MKLLTLTTLFPNAASPNQGIFVENRLRHLVASGAVESRVVAPVPWFPFRHAAFGRYAGFAKPPSEEMRFGLKVLHPRYPHIPKIGMSAAPLLLANAAKATIARLIDDGYDFDLIDTHYFYPDGVAAVMLGKYFNKPVVITARGSDITLIPRYRLPRKMILWAARNAAGIIAVCNALKVEMAGMGIEANRITTLRNGVDLQLFKSGDRNTLRAEFCLRHFTLLSVGHLVPVKGHELIIEALPFMSDVRLLLAGTGPERNKLETLARRLNVADRVTFLGAVPHADLKKYYTAADASILASSREGWANVLLESMACGTPAIASDVWGTPEVVASPDAGILIGERSPRGIAQAVQALRASPPDRLATRRYAEKFSWDETTAGQINVFKNILSSPAVSIVSRDCQAEVQKHF
jgi:teichuronic acid biosynthesis glycosyltransferase TuaC